MSDINKLEERLNNNIQMLDQILTEMKSIKTEINELKQNSNPAETPEKLEVAQPVNAPKNNINAHQNADLTQPANTMQDANGTYKAVFTYEDKQANSQTSYNSSPQPAPQATVQPMTQATGQPTQAIYNQQAQANQAPQQNNQSIYQQRTSIYKNNPQSVQQTSLPIPGQSYVPRQSPYTAKDAYPDIANNMGWQHPIPPQNRSYNQPNRKTIDTEAWLGKNIMAIAASVLIFISFILFATLLIPKLTEGMKITLMLLVSFGITGFGLYRWFKNKDSVFFLSLSACGIGSVYISLFLCNFYFHIINDIVLYVLILAWAGGVLYLSRYKRYIFEAIGYLGILVSIFFGSYSCGKNIDSMMLMILCIYAIIGFLAYLIFRMKDTISYILCSISGILGMGCLLTTAYNISTKAISSNGDTLKGSDINISSFLVIAFIIFMIVINLKQTTEKNHEYYPIIGGIYYSLIVAGVYIIKYAPTDNNVYAGFITLILNTVMYSILEYIVRKYSNFQSKGIGCYVWQIFMYIASILICFDLEQIRNTTAVFPLAIVLILYGFLLDSKLSRILGMITYGMLIFCFSLYPIPLMAFGILLFAAVNSCMYFKKDAYHISIKWVAFCYLLIGLLTSIIYYCDESDIDSEMTTFVVILILGLINFIGTKTKYANNWLTNESEESMHIIGYIVNACLMVSSLFAIMAIDNSILHFLMVLVAVALFTINSYNLLNEDKSWASVYIGIKFTVLLLFILYSYNSPEYGVSIATFILAIFFIILGFATNKKGLRIYGLVISMICVVKLVMIDISYQNTAGHALSFFISGVLCFTISALYSIADKRLKKDTQKPQNSQQSMDQQYTEQPYTDYQYTDQQSVEQQNIEY